MEKAKGTNTGMHYLLFYEVGDDYAARRAEFRAVHLEKAWEASERGELVLGGALTDPLDAAVLLFRGDSPAVAENFARADPYVTSGAVKRWYVREWKTVVGETAAKPVKSNSAAEKIAVEPSHHRATILRMWNASATTENAREYVQHATTKVFPGLNAIEGYRGAYLLRRAVDGAVHLIVLTLWQSMAAVRKFAGATPENAVVEPAARAMLTSFDDAVTHFEIVVGTEK
jgi:uncharacterized protein YciI/heme-degrading monooxygenase HmoA